MKERLLFPLQGTTLEFINESSDEDESEKKHGPKHGSPSNREFAMRQHPWNEKHHVDVEKNEQHGRDVPYSFNRKEAKDHGEGGVIVGAALAGRVLVIDDVISAGTSVRESISIIQQAGAETAGIAIALDRQERGIGELSASQEVNKEYGIPCTAIAGLDDLIRYLEMKSIEDIDLDAIQTYRSRYGTQT